MIRKLLHFLFREDGVAAVEFALIAPVLVAALVGMVDYGLYINAAMKLENEARAAAEYVYRGGDVGMLEEDVFLATMSQETYDQTTVDADFACQCSNGDDVLCDDEGICDGGYKRR